MPSNSVGDSPRVSVLMSVQNAHGMLPLALRSIQRQSLNQFECIVVDNGSTDGTTEIIRDWVASDQRFRMVRVSATSLVVALNTGLDHCRGELVARMDADDVMHRHRLRHQVESLDKQPQLAGVGAHVWNFPRRSILAGRSNYEGWLNGLRDSEAIRRERFIECPLAHPSLMLRRTIFQRYRYREQPWVEDYDLLLRLLGDGHELGVVPRRLLFWRDHPDRLSRNDPRCDSEQFAACRAFFLGQGPLSDGGGYILWGYGGTGKVLRRKLSDLGHDPVAIIELHPGRLGQKIFGVDVVHPEELSTLPALPLLVSVAGAVARKQIRAHLPGHGRLEGVDTWFCA